ncbi:MAG: type II 3-dehydroquinate dehydratase [Nitrospinae bacterium]|nr:type II 3-dehydroquinate dehydratase [Nitrospinota bacterium]
MGKKVLIVNGPNINMLGTREKDVYGAVSYDDMCAKLTHMAKELGISLEIFQSNHEGVLVDKIQAARAAVDLIIINPGAYTHTSIALRDALAAVRVPFIEVHISNIYAREEFRQKSFLSDIAAGLIAGFGVEGYYFALEAANRVIGRGEEPGARR